MKSENFYKRRWLLLAAGVIINVCAGGGYAWSVFQNPLMKMFGWTSIEASLAFTLVMGISALPMALVGKAQDYLQPRTVVLFGGLMLGGCMFATGYIGSLAQLYLIYGIGCGIGQGIVYSGVVANTVRFFPDKRGMSSGLLAAGMGSGAIVVAPLAEGLIDSFGVLAAFKVIGIIFNVIVCGLSLFIKKAPADYKPKEWALEKQNNKIRQNTGIDKDWRNMLKDPLFYFIAGMFITGTVSGVMIIGHASPMLQEVVKMTPQKAATFVGVISLFNTSGRVFWGWISDRIGRFNAVLILYVLVAAAMIGLTISTGALFTAITLVVGLCYGGFMSMIASLTADSFGAKHLPINFGIMFLAYGVAAFIGPRLAATIQAANNGDYSQAFLIAGAFSVLGILMTLTAQKLKNVRLEKFNIKLIE